MFADILSCVCLYLCHESHLCHVSKDLGCDVSCRHLQGLPKHCMLTKTACQVIIFSQHAVLG